MVKKLGDVEALDLAIKIAAEQHYGQLDKSGQPYIIHPISVMMKMDTIEEKIVAILHDVVEDTAISIRHLIDMGFSNIVVDAINSISKREFEKSESYYDRVISNRIATKVKMADLEHNMSFPRLLTVTKKDLERVKYYHEKWLMLKDRLVNDFNIYGNSKYNRKGAI